MIRVVSSDLPNPIGLLITQLECAERAANNLDEVGHLLKAIEEACPTGPKLDRTGQLHSSVLSSSIDHAVVVYCALFNSNVPQHSGIGMYSYSDVFKDDKNSLEWHKFLREYRNFEVAHLTSKNHKTFYLWVPHISKLIQTGTRSGKLCESIYPGSQLWDAFCQHMEKTQLWFEVEEESLREQIEKHIKAQAKGWLESLPSPVQNEHINEYWDQLVEAFRNSVVAWEKDDESLNTQPRVRPYETR